MATHLAGLNRRQRFIIGATAIVMTVMLLCPPFFVRGFIDDDFVRARPQGMPVSVGYGWLFDPPHEYAQVDIPLLLAQLVGALAIGGLLSVAAAGGRRDRDAPDDRAPAIDPARFNPEGALNRQHTQPTARTEGPHMLNRTEKIIIGCTLAIVVSIAIATWYLSDYAALLYAWQRQHIDEISQRTVRQVADLPLGACPNPFDQFDATLDSNIQDELTNKK